jgi:hypothetical protein
MSEPVRAPQTKCEALEMANLTNDRIAALANLYQPYLLFDPMERFFPVAAEEWLDHQATERWDRPPTHERGSAVLTVQKTAAAFSTADVSAGKDAPGGGPLKLSAAPPDGIGQPFPFDPKNQDLFLDCAGWDDTTSEVASGQPAFTTGSIGYLDKLFRDLANTMNSSIPTDTPSPKPVFDFSRVTAPTIYAEVEWAGRYPRLDQARVARSGDPPDFPGTLGGQPGTGGPLTALDSYLAFNYYFFYPAMEPSPGTTPDPDTSRNREGQWEAVSIFVKADPDFAHADPSGRPDFAGLGPSDHLFKIPRFAVYSRGYALGDDNYSPLAAAVRPWRDPLGRPAMLVASVDSHPIVYVAAGSHKNLFAIAATVTTGQTQPDPALNTTGGALMGAGGTMAGICLAFLPPPLTVGGVVCLVIAGIIFLIGLILFLLSFLLEPDPPVTESPQSSAPGTDIARDGGPAGIPAGVGSPPSPPGLPPSSLVATSLRVINRFGFGPTPPVNIYPPSAGDVELPFWWLFPGRWGVRVMNRAAGDWDSGTRRTDAFERSRGYWNTYQLVGFLGDAARSQDGIAP